MDGPRYPISSVDNALRLLLRCRDDEITLSDAAAELGVAKSTAHRLLAMLQHHDLVTRDSTSRAYRAGHTLEEIGLIALGRRDVRVFAEPAMRAAAADLDETIHLGVLDAGAVHYLDAIESTKAVRVAARTDRYLPAHCTSIGKILLAQLDDVAVASRLGPGPFARQTKKSLTTLDDVLAELASARRAGYAVNIGESEEGVVAVAVPIRDRRGVVVAAISCALPETRSDPNRVRVIADTLTIHARRLVGSMNADDERFAVK